MYARIPQVKLTSFFGGFDLKRFIALAASAALSLSLCACGSQQSAATSEEDVIPAEETPIVIGSDIALNGGNATMPEIGLVDDETGAIGPVITVDPYASGIHHASLKIKGYGTMEIEIYSNTAPKTSALFCYLVRHKYYNGLNITSVMPDLYATLGDYSGKTSGVYTVDGEFKEAGYENNSIGLKRGVIAMSRLGADQNLTGPSEVKSDASSFYVFLSDASYLDGKYAGFAKITSGISTFDQIVSAIGDTDEAGKIKNEKDCPVISSIKLVD